MRQNILPYKLTVRILILVLGEETIRCNIASKSMQVESDIIVAMYEARLTITHDLIDKFLEIATTDQVYLMDRMQRAVAIYYRRGEDKGLNI